MISDANPKERLLRGKQLHEDFVKVAVGVHRLALSTGQLGALILIRWQQTLNFLSKVFPVSDFFFPLLSYSLSPRAE